MKEFIEQDQQTKTILDNALQEQKYLIFFYCIKEWHNLSEELQKIVSTVQLKPKILSFTTPKENSIFKIHDTNNIKLLNRLRLHFSHLNEHKFRHNVRTTTAVRTRNNTALPFTLKSLLWPCNFEKIGGVFEKFWTFHWPSLLTFYIAKNITWTNLF